MAVIRKSKTKSVYNAIEVLYGRSDRYPPTQVPSQYAHYYLEVPIKDTRSLPLRSLSYLPYTGLS
jgi:hypothetical protein